MGLEVRVMSKRLLLLSAAVFALVCCSIGTKCFAEDVSEQLERADDFRNRRDYDDAEAIYKEIAQECAGTDYGLTAQQNLVCLYSTRGRTEEAEATYQQLLTGYGDHDGIAGAVDDIADAYYEQKKYDKALDIYSYMVDTWADSAEAAGAQAGIARANIALGKEEAAQAAIDKLVGDFSHSANIADAVDEVADKYRDASKYDKAMELYKYVVNTWPESEQAIGSQGCIVRINIALGDDPNAKAAVDKLIAEFGGRDDIVEAVRDVAEEYQEAKKYEKAIELYNYVVDNWRESEEAIESQRCIVRINIELGDDPNAKVAIDELIAKFAGRDDIAEQVQDVAGEYQNAKRYDKAVELYKYVIDNWPGDRQAIWSQLGVVRLYIGLGDDPNTEAAIDKLVRDFSSNTELPAALNRIAEIYEGLKKYEESRSFYEQVIQRAPDSVLAKKAEVAIRKVDFLSLVDSVIDANSAEAAGITIPDFNEQPGFPNSVFLVAEKRFYKGRYRQAIELWEFIQEEYPQSPLRSKIPFLLATCYERLKDTDNAIKYYKQVLEQYPDSKYAYRAPYNLGTLYGRDKRDYEQAIYWFQQQRKLYSNEVFGDWALYGEGLAYAFRLRDYEKGAEVFESYMEIYPAGKHIEIIRYNLARCYEKMGDKAKAIELLEEGLQEYPDMVFAESYREKLAQLR